MVPRHFNLDEYNYSAKRCALTGRSYTTTTTTTNGTFSVVKGVWKGDVTVFIL